jgi:hypothetical protein
MRDNWKKLGLKHLIDCHCTLKIYEKNSNVIYHKFPVYTKFDENGKAIVKLAHCNNCGTIHKVIDICKSEIIRSGKDKNVSEIDIEDIALQIDTKICNVLRRYNCDIAIWENVLDILENEAWNYPIVLSREVIEGKYHVKILEIKSDSKFKIITKKIEDEIDL